jgi:hypothetical protein
MLHYTVRDAYLFQFSITAAGLITNSTLAMKCEECFCYRTKFPRIAEVFHGKALA